MKAVILAGGLGTRISEESTIRPKPMIEIGGRPVLWHIMKIYSAHGINEFVILCGYKQYMIKEYFANYFLHMSDVTFDMRTRDAAYLCNHAEPWRVTLVDTGEDTLTGGRLKRVRQYLGDETFCFTYGDGVGNVDITRTIDFHRQHGKLATMTVMQPPGRFGAVSMEDGGTVTAFQEKPDGDGGWINGGFFVLEPAVIDYIEGDHTTWEAEPLRGLAHDGQLAAFRHPGFWQPMDTLRDKHLLEDLWRSGKAPWKAW
ncbi:glucose-1-phosphate cytidylyltransferase [Deinococcus metallilatus]|uniref:Glucose-1-phosphate cytidylyltransferase n=2 Tax=Deinococcus TaxID=1298 RepID=A0AAJ5F145_9DEIO|nr:glucose-1-phosphate cytidylyltransferase [Deinococcus metallilatus]MBB5296823.1 glucose-1-phosphate cytidylyltransferase [Deinococcus metallilatus]QBY09561.1 glucose-1-phosphate cytidylyltransferase [Deinococcus metallilatus]RXJ09165.1 glucose-1-phosphate cytidylyltransferase [Deinococcus metallilatus]TLK22791.1 glucose-1-phosphate cytidylyltransferase [Deinococcus metallilatus]GMA13854.1 glucose-1-phosphate cytidylyltransferase [Deinococcus metallilatus]